MNTCLFANDIDKYACAVYRQHWDDGTLYEGSICDVTASDVCRRGVPDVICGGVPCQDVSVAGKRAGLQEGNRTGLWFEMLRLVSEIRPKYVLIENVPGLLQAIAMEVQNERCICGWNYRWGGVHYDSRVENKDELLCADRCWDGNAQYPSTERIEGELRREHIGWTESDKRMGFGDKLENIWAGSESIFNQNTTSPDTKERASQAGVMSARNDRRITRGKSGGKEMGQGSTKEGIEDAVASDGTEQERTSGRSIQSGVDCPSCGRSVGNTTKRLVRRSGLHRILCDFAEIGYDAEWETISASAFGAPHQRDRIFIVAYPRLWRLEESTQQRSVFGLREERDSLCEPDRPSEVGIVADTYSIRCHTGRDIERKHEHHISEVRQAAKDKQSGHKRVRRIEQVCAVTSDAESIRREEQQQRIGAQEAFTKPVSWWQVESRLRGIPDGLSTGMDANRVNRLKCLGNAIVPQVAQYVGECIMAHNGGEFTFAELFCGIGGFRLGFEWASGREL